MMIYSRERTRFSLQLGLQCLSMVDIDMRVAHDMDEFSRLDSSTREKQLIYLKITNMAEEMSQQGIGGDVERNTKTHICRSLIHLLCRGILEDYTWQESSFPLT